MKTIIDTRPKKRVIIENVKPNVNNGKFAIKRVEWESVTVTSDILCDGHDTLDAMIVYKMVDEENWQTVPMYLVENDTWQGTFSPTQVGDYIYNVRAWVDIFLTWQNNLIKKFRANQDISIEILDGASIIRNSASRAPIELAGLLNASADELENSNDRLKQFTIATNMEITALIRSYPDLSNSFMTENDFPLIVNKKMALFSSWYEFFPRSFSDAECKGCSLKNSELSLPAIAAMGFDVVYLPPIHPIGTTNRKGKNNTIEAKIEDPGSPWAIGSKEGGHKSVDPELGTIEDFRHFIKTSQKYGITVAIDLAFQCSPDHPYCKDHPEWFKHRADGSIQFAENPPKRYEDIVPFNFETEYWKELWDELLSVVLFWIDEGVTVFRVDNPHTKPLPFWQWLINRVRNKKGDIIFLSESFTRPKIMYHLAKIGFTQSYTYFTWRNTKKELQDYLIELTKSDIAEYYRPNFWPNTPDILPEYLQLGGESAFLIRIVLAATLSSNYGIYGPAFECTITDAIPGKEEYLNSEKYEIKKWEQIKNNTLIQLITALNIIRKGNPALQNTKNIQFMQSDNDQTLIYCKKTDDLKNCIIIAVDLDPFHSQKTKVDIPLHELNLAYDQAYLLEDLLSGERYFCIGPKIELNIGQKEYPAFIFNVRRQVVNESQFSYY